MLPMSIGRQADGACYIFADPDVAPADHVFWDRTASDYALSAKVANADHRDHQATNLFALPTAITILHRPNYAPQVILSHDLKSVQIELCGSAKIHEPLQLYWRVSGLTGLRPQLVALHRLAALHAYGRMPKALFPPVTRVERLIAALRAGEGHDEGASLTQLAEALFGIHHVRNEWRDHDFVRSRVRRLLRLSGNLIQNGYRRLLR